VSPADSLICLPYIVAMSQKSTENRRVGNLENQGLSSSFWPITQGIRYCWRTQKCRNLCIPHAFLEVKKAEEMSPRKSTLGTLKGVSKQYRESFLRTNAEKVLYFRTLIKPDSKRSLAHRYKLSNCYWRSIIA